MFKTLTGGRARTRLAVAGVTLGALVAAAPAGSASTPGGEGGARGGPPPHPAASWPGVRDATQFAPHCPQPASPFGQASTSENCLFLNVFTPSHPRAGARFPGMVWIHG